MTDYDTKKTGITFAVESDNFSFIFEDVRQCDITSIPR
jgi:hypothetical protein